MNPVPKKRLGQNFLTEQYYAKRIAYAIHSNDKSKVLEIGSGLGALSIFLKERFPRFHMIEMDKEIIPILKEKLGVGDWILHEGDVMDFDFHSVGSSLHIVGNLPYNYASYIIKKSLFYAPTVLSITFMLQKEVAQRIVSGPNSKKIGFLSIFCQFFGKPKILFHVPCGAFFPKPKVESSVLQLFVDENLQDRLAKEKWEDFFAFVSRGFLMRRKMLVKSLSLKTDNKDIIKEAFKLAGLELHLRAENLTVFDWLKLYCYFQEIQ